MYYFMNKEHGYLVSEFDLWEDANQNGYNDMCDPCSCEYCNWKLHYSLANYRVK